MGSCTYIPEKKVTLPISPPELDILAFELFLVFILSCSQLLHYNNHGESEPRCHLVLLCSV